MHPPNATTVRAAINNFETFIMMISLGWPNNEDYASETTHTVLPLRCAGSHSQQYFCSRTAC